jgi:hypothetical protein
MECYHQRTRVGIARSVIVSENEGKSKYYAMSLIIKKQEVLMTIPTD